MNQTQNSFSWQNLLVGILYLIAGIIVFNNPLLASVWLVYLIAFGWIISGIVMLTMRDSIERFTGTGSGWIVFFGIVEILLGVFLLFNQAVGLIALPILFAVWFLTESIGMMFSSRFWREYNSGHYWFQLIAGILGVILALILLFNPLSSLITLELLVGSFFIIAAVTRIVAAF